MPLTIKQLIARKPRNRSFKEASEDEKEATHELSIIVKGVGTAIDMDLFRAVGRYSDSSGCGFGERDHQWLLRESEVQDAETHLGLMMASLERLNKTKIEYTVTVAPYRR